MSPKVKRLYDALPVSAQNIILTSYNMLLDRERYGGQFRSYQRWLENSQWYSAEQLQSYQDQELRQLIEYSYNNVPYYRRVMRERDLRPKDIRTSADLVKLPLLTRTDVQQNASELLSRGHDHKTVKKGHTSGTTGSPLELCYDDRIIQMTYALLDRHYHWADARLKRFGDRVAVLRGNPIVPLARRKPPFWRYNYLHKQLLLSSFHMSTKNLPHYVGEIKRYSPQVLDGYPSTLYVLAKYLRNTGQKLTFGAAITSSETLYDFQRELIEESFNCKVFDYYAAAERVVFSGECDRHEGHHVADEYGITEVLDRVGSRVAVGGVGTLVATSLHNYAMPMIRYITNDMVSFKKHVCSCGRGLSLMDDVTTKAEDILTLRDGRVISPSVLTHPFKPLVSIEASQIVQEDLDHVCIKLVVTAKFSEANERILISSMKERLGAGVDVRIEKVESLDRTSSGKFKWVISKVELGL